jgi:hypothetical protein
MGSMLGEDTACHIALVQVAHKTTAGVIAAGNQELLAISQDYLVTTACTKLRPYSVFKEGYIYAIGHH